MFKQLIKDFGGGFVLACTIYVFLFLVFAAFPG